jgi:PHD/YefM family antitoxin component YafN of YafNO toxin-antitoxin module
LAVGDREIGRRSDLLDRLRKTGHPLVLTINGKAELVVQDAEAYQALLDRVEAIEGQRGLADVKAGRTKAAGVFVNTSTKKGIDHGRYPQRISAEVRKGS